MSNLSYRNRRRSIISDVAACKEQQPETIRINPAMKRHFELEIQTLQNAPRDEDKLRELLKLKERQNEQATHI
jgi:hypothetical protein